MNQAPESFENVTVSTKANVYFEGKVVSHTVRFAGGAKKSLGLIYPGVYAFSTAEPEEMAIVAGACRARIAGEEGWTDYPAGTSFAVPGSSSFEIAVDAGIAEYVCSFG